MNEMFYVHGVPRYAYQDVVRRIDEAIRVAKIAPKAVYDSVKITKDAWSRKMRDEGNRFSYDEISAIAEHLGKPPGWPYIDEAVASANERALRILAELGRVAEPTRNPSDASPADATREMPKGQGGKH